jgi:hypothetical protein
MKYLPPAFRLSALLLALAVTILLGDGRGGLPSLFLSETPSASGRKESLEKSFRYRNVPQRLNRLRKKCLSKGKAYLRG